MSKVSRLAQVTSPAIAPAQPPTFDASELLKSLPHRPGVYRMQNAAGRLRRRATFEKRVPTISRNRD
jgi:hypothetical protein